MKLDDTRGNVYYYGMEKSIQPNGNPNTNVDNKQTGDDKEQPQIEIKAEEQEVEKKDPLKVETPTDKKEDANKDADKVVIESYEKKLADQKKVYEEKLKARDDRIRQLIKGEVEEKQSETSSVVETINKRRTWNKW